MVTITRSNAKQRLMAKCETCGAYAELASETFAQRWADRHVCPTTTAPRRRTPYPSNERRVQIAIRLPLSLKVRLDNEAIKREVSTNTLTVALLDFALSISDGIIGK